MPYTIYEKAGSDAAVAAALAALPPGGDSLPANAAGVLTNDGAGILTWEAVPSGSLDTEAVQDIVGAMVTGAGGTYNDAAGTITLPGGGSGTITADDTPAAPAEGESASYLVTSAVVWPSGLVWSTDPDGGTAPNITGTALVSLFTVGGVTRAVMGATFPGVVVPDTTAPVAGTLAVVPSSTSALGTVTGASDAEALDAAPYSFRLDAGAWSAWQASASYTWTGLTASTAYAFQHRVRDAAGNITEGTAVTDTTDATPAADTTAPTWTATFTLGTPTSSAVAATASALASDNVAVTGYEVSYDNAATWTAIVPSGSNFTLAGTAGTTYSTTKLRAKDAAGNYSTALSVPSYTMAAEDVDAYPSATIYDTFSNAADNTSLAGSNGVTNSQRTVEKGDLLWGAWTMPLYTTPTTEGEAYGQTNTAHINGGKLYEPNSVFTRAAMLNLAQTKVLAEFDYDVTATGKRVTLSLAGSSTQAIHARLFQGEGLKVFLDGGTQLGATMALATFGGATGTIGMSYDPATGAVKVYQNGAERFTATTTTGLTGTYFGLDYTGGATIDNVRVTYL